MGYLGRLRYLLVGTVSESEIPSSSFNFWLIDPNTDNKRPAPSVACTATPGFTTSHSLRPPISSLSRQSSVRSTRDLSFSSTGGPPSSAGPAREVTAAAAAAAAVGGSMSGPAVGRSSSLRNPMLSRPDWRLTNDDVSLRYWMIV